MQWAEWQPLAPGTQVLNTRISKYNDIVAFNHIQTSMHWNNQPESSLQTYTHPVSNTLL